MTWIAHLSIFDKFAFFLLFTYNTAILTYIFYYKEKYATKSANHRRRNQSSLMPWQPQGGFISHLADYTPVCTTELDSIQKPILGYYANTALGIAACKKDYNYDAWITYTTEHNNLKDFTQLIPLPDSLRLYQGTPIVLAQNSKHKEQGEQFIQFLQSKNGHQVFQK